MQESSHKTGRCHCGDARYELTGEPLVCYACHCTDCQSASGSAFTLSMILEASAVTPTEGTLGTNEYELNGNTLLRYHCARCGGTLWFSSPTHANIVALKPGTLDDTSSLEPQAHLWYRSAQRWFELPDDAVVYPEQPDIAELLALAQSRPGQ